MLGPGEGPGLGFRNLGSVLNPASMEQDAASHTHQISDSAPVPPTLTASTCPHPPQC